MISPCPYPVSASKISLLKSPSLEIWDSCIGYSKLNSSPIPKSLIPFINFSLPNSRATCPK